MVVAVAVVGVVDIVFQHKTGRIDRAVHMTEALYYCRVIIQIEPALPCSRNSVVYLSVCTDGVSVPTVTNISRSIICCSGL